MESLLSAKLFLLDMDGTLYLGNDVFEGAIDFINRLRETGRKYIYLTNNSSRSGEDYIIRLRQLGFPCEKENVFTSGMATALFLRSHSKSVYPVGTNTFINELIRYGVKISDTSPDSVVVGFDTELEYKKLERAVHFLRNGADFIAANPDLVCPMPNNEVLPDCGSICALLTSATGKTPKYIGKPDRRMIDIISKDTGISNDKIVMIGDRLYTDIAAGKNAEAVTVCVLSGETTSEMINNSKIKPDYIFNSVKDIISYL